MLGFRSSMCTRQHSQACLNTSLSIRQEIQRFESVHPSIYALYDLVELVPDPLLAQQIRDHVVAIEDSFVNSQEWTSARGVTELRVGVLGSPDSGKSALVHRYLTGAYMQEESPEGGRFKKEVIIDGHSYLLLIRDEGGSPEMQFTAWVDAVIFVFSLENESSYNTVSNYFNKMSHYRNSAEIPIILVGTQDAISESSPRVVDDNRARKLTNELRRCSYYETCATYGLNVERVFQDACQKIVGTRLSASSQCLSGSRPVTPQPLANSPSHNHSTFLYKDYMEDVNGKEIALQYVTVKVPGQKPRGSKSIITTVPGYNGYTNFDIHDSIGGLSLGYKDKPTRATDKALMSAFEAMKEPASSRQSLASEIDIANGTDKDTPHVKKRHRRMKSSGVKKDEEEGEIATSCEFTIVSLDGKRWRWEVCGGSSPGAAAAERDAWVAAVEAQILASLQGRTSRQPAPTGANSTGDVRATYYIRRVKGNDKCCDCGAADPDWASLNLGVLICIECSGIHRNLGSHISRVRSLDLDEWPLGHVSVMVSMGNTLANSIWEADLRGHIKPIAASSREDKERWIRMKYERRAFLSSTDSSVMGDALKTASARGGMSTIARLLAAPPPRAPSPTERSLALRAAAAAGNLSAAQLLIWHNGNPNFPDADGHTCLFYARAAANHLSGIPTQFPKNLQITCPLHPSPPQTSGNTSTSSSSSAKSKEIECNCIIFELLNAQSSANALIDILLGLQNNQFNFDVAGGFATLSRPSLGPNLSLTNGKCGSIV
ncbi:centaurin-gamma-1A isoform X4 [Pieris brassicae]|uniref:centaurin-gamma-1A isoform X4 n=1 Tax=Pieris brassicae TaxID=7116 RepID=UPI001E660860|nr:centaurin-gamma-1A isoform X4 [Pieris brassicae]